MMQEFGKFSQYTPTGKTLTVDGGKVIYLQDEQGNDWYDVQKQFSENTLKVGYDEDGRVRTFCTDVYAFFPMNLSAVELPATKANMRVRLGDDWFYKDGKLQQIRDYVAIATAERDRIMSEAADAIAPLQDAADVDLATDEELQRLKAWKTYRVMLSRLDLSTAPDIKWPIKPE